MIPHKIFTCIYLSAVYSVVYGLGLNIASLRSNDAIAHAQSLPIPQVSDDQQCPVLIIESVHVKVDSRWDLMSAPDLFVKISSQYVSEEQKEVSNSFTTHVVSDTYYTGRLLMSTASSADDPWSSLKFCSMHPLSIRPITISIYDQDLGSSDDLIDELSLKLTYKAASQGKTYTLKGKYSTLKASARLMSWREVVGEHVQYVQTLYDLHKDERSPEDIKPWGTLSLKSLDLADGRSWSAARSRGNEHAFKLKVQCMHNFLDTVLRLDSSCAQLNGLKLQVLNADDKVIEALSDPQVSYRSFDSKKEVVLSGTHVRKMSLLLEPIEGRALVARIVNDSLGQQLVKERVEQSTEVLSIKLNDKLESEVFKRSPIYQVPTGQEKIVEDTVRFRKTSSLSVSKSLEAEAKLNLEFVELGVRGKLEKIYSESFTEEHEFKRSVRLLGNGKALQVVWIHLYRTGVAEVEYVSGYEKRHTQIPFRYRDGFDLILEEVQ